MKVLYDYQIFLIRQYGGVARYFVELASRLGRFPDVRVQAISPFFRSQLLSEHKSRIATVGIDLSVFPKLPAQLLRSINLQMFRALATVAAPDIVHETYYEPIRTAPKSSKIITTMHDTIPERFPQFFPGFKLHQADKQKVLLRADRVICVSESSRKDLLELYDVNPAHVSVVLLASSIEPPREGPIDVGSPYFLHVGRRYHYKNFNGLIQAFGADRLYRTHKLVSFTPMPFSTAELEVMKRAGVPHESVVRVGGDDTVLARYYAGADALVFPSMYEGFGIPLLEAMRCSCPIVTSQTGSLPEVAGDAAIYCDPGDVTSISQALLKIASSPETRANLIAKGLVRAQGFSWDRCATETYAVYQDALSHP